MCWGADLIASGQDRQRRPHMLLQCLLPTAGRQAPQPLWYRDGGTQVDTQGPRSLVREVGARCAPLQIALQSQHITYATAWAGAAVAAD